jgi:hypothetical protein
MLRRSYSILLFVGCSLLAIANPAAAQTALTRATVESMQNRVQVILQSGNSRAARIADTLSPGDGLTTGQASLAELRFNDGSLGRMGEQVIFWFTPGTRNFSLSNGTVLLLIPPGQGSTYIRTPNAAAGIQGSALFVRYIQETDTTLIGALTDSGIRAYNTDGSQSWVLEAGQLAVAVGDRLDAIYNFDLDLFHETSALMRGVSPRDGNPSDDDAIAQVQQEMQAALDSYTPVAAQEAIDTPTFVLLPPSNGAMPTNLTMPDYARQPFVPPATERNGSDRTTPSTRETLRESGEVSQDNRDRPTPADPTPPANPQPNRPDPQPNPQPGRPNNQPNRPNQPNPQPGRPNNQPNRPDPQPDRPNQPDRPDPPGRPNRPDIGNPTDRPDRPAPQPDRPNPPNPQPDRPNPQPDRPNPQPDRPGNGNFPGVGPNGDGTFPGVGPNGDGTFPGQGRGVQDGFPGQGQGVQDGFPGQGQGR